MRIVEYETLPSTNSTACEAARSGGEEFYTVAANTQTAGRGRGEHSFFSPPEGLYFSTVLRPRLPLAEFGKLTPFAAVAIRRAVKRVCGAELSVKWVNDLLLDGKKVAGILAESGLDTAGERFVVLGIGINTGRADFPPELAAIAANLPCPDKKALLAAIIEELAAYEDAVREGKWLPEYRAHLAYLGERVSFSVNGQAREAICRGVTEEGALMLEMPSGECLAFGFGEISPRPAQKRS